MNGPLPSQRVFLSQLSSLPADTKVRFLGCVSAYHVSTGHLILQHNFSRKNGDPTIVSVDINLLLETMKADDLRIGAWLNVLGYVRVKDRDHLNSSPIATTRAIYIEAIMVFSAEAVRIGEYERILCDAQDVDHVFRR
ncbi:hypothetical protein ASPZODRAFT_131073 [Penicilliopsis zonata CBS 506.65]|uniref:CST complex subunit Ten1 n=1 Tax=Penicilliopsis zonata CBS 506.65 TaxID=1073090 RepID=A0A1L9SK08_9EURO|nr:hypothetical protein ASPZODRAFT_131073 [Penicilliopsis zonata CBS 506.65]OJJ47550.1 hypothetical protein ASPZODRAFT_131073 [Penicilliopsis zonata CBS 506.65]